MTTIPTYSAVTGGILKTPVIDLGAATAATPSSGGIPADLSMPELMEWLGNTIQKTDDQIRQQMTSMTSAKNAQGAIGKAIEELNKLQMNDAGDGKDNVEGSCLADGSYKQQDWYKQAGPDAQKVVDDLVSKMGLDRPASDYEKSIYALYKAAPDMGTFGKSFYASFGATNMYEAPDGTLMVKGDHRVSRDETKSAIDALTQDLSSLQSNNDTNMIKLQSAVSSRSQMIEMISNMVHSIDDTAKNVVGNLR